MSRSILPAVILCLAGIGVSDGSYYDEAAALFTTRPAEDAPLTNIGRFGPVGLSIDLVQPAFTMRIKDIEKGSPADRTGQFARGQYILRVNGQALRGIDPRVQMADWISAAEASDGRLVFEVATAPDAAPRRVTVSLPVLGAYSPTWPLNCPKSDRIVRNFAAYLKAEGTNKGFADIGMLFLLSTGDEDDLAYVRQWARSHKGELTYPWHIGYGGLALCEYYLRTGDEQVLPAIQKMADHAVSIETFGGWAGRGPLAAVTYGGGGGHLNAGGTLLCAYLLLARECGAAVPDDTLLRVLRHFYRFAGRGNNPYGNNRPESSFVDNGKNGLIAFSMAAAASLTPDGENSIYARARDAAAMTSFYTTGHMLHGHTGGGIGEIWRSAAMGLLHDKRPAHYRAFMDQRRFHYELSRRFDGSFAILGGARYDNEDWGAGYALTYTVPRRTLRLTGAPPSPHSKPFQLPAQIWGTQADNVFLSLDPATLPDGRVLDLAGETLRDAGKAVIDRLNSTARVDGRIPDDVLIAYAHHPDFLMRRLATHNMVGFRPNYMFDEAGDPVRPDLITLMLRSADPRVRHAMLRSMVTSYWRDGPDDLMTREHFDLALAMIRDPDEAWTVKDAAMQLVGYAPADWIVPHVDVILPYLEHEEWWLQNAAVIGLTEAIADPRTYAHVLPAVGRFASTCPLWNAVAPLRGGRIAEALANAPPQVQERARLVFQDSYLQYREIDSLPQEVNEQVNRTNREYIAAAIARLPGGYDVLYEMASQRFPDDPLPYRQIFLEADPAQLEPALAAIIRKAIVEELIPQYIQKNRQALQQEADNQPVAIRVDRNPLANARLDGLVDLYRKAGINDYDWRDFGPEPQDMVWSYFSFDPGDDVPWVGEVRYRPIRFPEGMENWHQPDFDPQAHGWRSARGPFGEFNGRTDQLFFPNCRLDYCRCNLPIATLWENEVLLLHGRFQLPEFKQGHRYRLLVGGMSHVGHGSGYRIYVNGRLLAERNRGIGKREGSQPVGAFIDHTFWDDMSGKQVTLAVIGFQHLRHNTKYRHMMLWLQEMKVPPLAEPGTGRPGT